MIGWFDAASGASGDMLLGALLDAGASLTAVRAAVESVAPEQVAIELETVRRGALAARRARVTAVESTTHRGLPDVLALIAAADLQPSVAQHAAGVFTLLAEAEATVHGVDVSEVHFHEVGALDAIADIVGGCAALVDLGLDALSCSTIAVGSGSVQTAHGTMSVPVPAVVALLTGRPTEAGPAARELCTPTGAAMLAHWVTAWGGQPPMAVRTMGVGAGGADLVSHANVLRLLIGTSVEPRAADDRGAAGDGAVVLETNVDDLDPRLWPGVLAALLAGGAADAWLTPILMKKGRPAHTLSVLVRGEHAAAVRAVVFAETSAIGLRERVVVKHELERRLTRVDVHGESIGVKIALDLGRVVNAQPEFEDVAAAARALGLPAKVVLAEAVAAAQTALRL